MGVPPKISISLLLQCFVNTLDLIYRPLQWSFIAAFLQFDEKVERRCFCPFPLNRVKTPLIAAFSISLGSPKIFFLASQYLLKLSIITTALLNIWCWFILIMIFFSLHSRFFYQGKKFESKKNFAYKHTSVH